MCTVAKFSILVATPRSKWRLRWTTAPSAARRFPRAPRRAQFEAVELRESASPLATWARARSTAVDHVNERDRRRAHRPGGRATSARWTPTHDRGSTARRTRACSAPTPSSGASLAVAKAAAEAAELHAVQATSAVRTRHLLPTPMMNILNGGVHADNSVRLPGVHDHARRARPRSRKALRWCAEIYHTLEEGAARMQGLGRGRRRRGRLRPRPEDQRRSRFELISWKLAAEGRLQARRTDILLRHGSRPPPSSTTPETGKYVLEPARVASRARASEMVDYWEALVEPSTPSSPSRTAWPEEDWDGWKKLTDRIGDRVQLVGDDLFVTNSKRLAEGHRAGLRQRHSHQGEPDRLASPRRSRPSRWPSRPATPAS